MSSRYSSNDPPKDLHLKYPVDSTRKTQEVVKEIKKQITGQKAQAAALKLWFKKQGFLYTLTPGRVTPETVDGFMNHKKGFCEHFAATYATMLRIAGIPSRVVVGFHGGEENPFTGATTIRGHDAHAWVEAYFKGDSGWTLLDPTEAVAPERIALGGQHFHGSITQSIASLLPSDLRKSLWMAYRYVIAFFEYLGEQWRRLNEVYSIWFDSTFDGDFDPRYVILVLMIGLYVFIKKSSKPRPPKLTLLFATYTKKMKTERQKSETETEYIQRVEQKFGPLPKIHQTFLETFLIAKYYTLENKQKIKEIKSLLKQIPQPSSRNTKTTN